jgi:hypothetical protein
MNFGLMTPSSANSMKGEFLHTKKRRKKMASLPSLSLRTSERNSRKSGMNRMSFTRSGRPVKATISHSDYILITSL